MTKPVSTKAKVLFLQDEARYHQRQAALWERRTNVVEGEPLEVEYRSRFLQHQAKAKAMQRQMMNLLGVHDDG
jgi:hypothetical protein